MSNSFTDWESRLESMKRCRTAAELIELHGAPAHKVQEAQMEIWHYPLGIVDGNLHSIHVAIDGDNRPMAYMHLEPTRESGSPPRRRWWRFWERAGG